MSNLATRDCVLVLGSASIHVERFVRGLCAAGQSVVLATHGALPLEGLPGLLHQTTVDLSFASRTATRDLHALIDRWRPNLLHVHQANTVAWHAARACAGRDLPYVLTLWGSDVLLTPRISLLHRWMVRTSLRAAALWTADSVHLLDAAERVSGVKRPTAIVVMGVDNVPDSLGAIWPDKQRAVLSCRLHKPLYRVDAVIRAFASLPRQEPPWTLEVAASGPQTGELRALAESSGAAGATRFTGFLGTTAMANSLRVTSVYVSFPCSDGTSVSLLEAMSLGCFPVVSDLPANREWVVDGLNGLVVRNETDLAPAIETAMQISLSARWRNESAPANLRLVQNKASFADNICQFVATYARVRP